MIALPRHCRLLLAGLMLGLTAVPPAGAAPQVLPLYGGRGLTVDVPAGWKLTTSQAENGLVSARLAGPDEHVSLQITFFPDVEGKMASAGDQAKLVEEIAGPYVADSVEKEARVVPLKPRRGSGAYCVFTDAKLADKAELPAGEYRHATTGIRASAGWFGLFTLFSQDTASADYRAALDLLRNSLLPAGAAPARKRNPDAF